MFANVYNNKYVGVIDTEHINLNITAVSGNISNQFSFNKGWKAETYRFLYYKRFGEQ